MKKNLLYAFLFLLLWSSCSGEDSEDPGTTTTFQLGELIVNLDGAELTRVSVSNFAPTFDGSSFIYTTGQGDQDGTWEVNGDNTSLNVTFEGSSLDFPVVSNDAGALVFVGKTIDLTSELSAEDQRVLLMVGQQIFLEGKRWSTVSASAQSLELLFNLNNQ